MGAIGKWLLNILIGRLLEFIKRLVDDYIARKKKQKEREEDNKRAEQKLEEAQSEQEVIDAGSGLLKR